MSKVTVTDQLDAFVPDVDTSQFVGHVDERYGIEYLSEPAWRADLEKWVCLANVRGMLCLVSVKITAVPA